MPRLVATVLTIFLFAAACGSDDGEEAIDTSDPTEQDTSTTDGPDEQVLDVPAGATITSVTDDLTAKPELELEPSDEAPDELIIDDVVEGDGAEVEAGAIVEVQYLGVLTDGTEFDASWTNGGAPITFGLDQVIAGWGEGLVGMREGGRRTLIIPSDLAYGPQGQGTIPPGATLVFVVDLISIDRPATPGVEVTSVSDDLEAPPEVELEPADEAPEDVVVDDIVLGDGDAVPTDGDPRVEVHFVGLLTDGTQYESSWASAPVEFNLSQVVEGVGEGLRGMQVGGRRTLVVPPELGYGDMGTPNGLVPPGATLVYVVDLTAIR